MQVPVLLGCDVAQRMGKGHFVSGVHLEGNRLNGNFEAAPCSPVHCAMPTIPDNPLDL